MYRFLTVFSISAFLLVNAQDRDRDHQNQQSQRYYDKAHKDWHDWNDDQEHSFHQYLQEHHMKDHDFARASVRERNAYFAWSHEHQGGDHDRH